VAEKRQLLSAIVRNRSGVLAQVSGLFASRGFSIDSLTVGETDDPAQSRMTIVTRGEERTLEQIRKQLERLIEVIKVSEFDGAESVERELVLVKVHAPPPKRPEIVSICEVFRGRVVDLAASEMTIEIVGPPARTAAFIDLVRPYGLKEVARTGSIAMARGG
jgi:acetolactate synthase I/III small subunit